MTEVAAALDPQVASLQRAMPLSRLLDCGMDLADARLLHAETSAGRSWIEVATRLADERETATDAAVRAGHLITARQSARWAAAAALFAQMAENTDTPRKVELYARYDSLVRRFCELSEPPIERVEVGYEHGHLVGWLCLPIGGEAWATVVVWGGLSGWGAAYLSVAEALTERGIACLLAEGPGQGRPRLTDALFLTGQVADGFARFVDVIGDDPRLGPAVGVYGVSFGGLFAAHLAAQDDRIGACAINGAPSTPTVPTFRTAREQVAAAVGTDDEIALAVVLDALAFDPDRHALDCPVLVVHGGQDPLVPDVSIQMPFVVAAGDRGELREWPDGEHTIYNHAAERTAAVADWFVDQLVPDAHRT